MPAVANPNKLTSTDKGNPVLRSNLTPFSLCDDGNHIIVDRGTCTVLCRGIKLTWGMFFTPIVFDQAKALAWVENGTIGELQDEFSNLAISFTNVLVKPPRWKTDSVDPEFRDVPLG